ncbi:MAG: hypothetical protein ACREJU_02510 [Nitrospiraceae bacterium]
MKQEAAELRNLDQDADWSHVTSKRARPLTHDEKKAAEAAFQQLPFNPEWSEAARRVYDGIIGVMAELKPNSVLLLQSEMGAEAAWEKVV